MTSPITASNRVQAALQASHILDLCQDARPFTMPAYGIAFDIIQELEAETIDHNVIADKIEQILLHVCWKAAARRNPEALFWRDRYIGIIASSIGLPVTASCQAAIDMSPDDWLNLYDIPYD
jgi:hypothetical protein